MLTPFIFRHAFEDLPEDAEALPEALSELEAAGDGVNQVRVLWLDGSRERLAKWLISRQMELRPCPSAPRLK